METSVVVFAALFVCVSASESGEHHCYGAVKVGGDIVGFILITSATLYIGYKNATYKGPSGNEPNFNGFKEENMIAFFINIFASVAYWARMISNATCGRGFLMLTHFRYCDYLTTCPLLVLDLCWNLEAPYKCTAAGLILITLLTGVACSLLPPPQSYLWFAFGDIIFFITYAILLVIVRSRMAFFVARARNEMAIKAMYYIKFACCCFFLIWIWFPLLWIVSPYCLNYIDIELLDLFHMFLDVCAKSVYGVVLLWFRWHYDKKLLRNVDEEEFYEFTAKCPERQAVLQVMVDNEDDVVHVQQGGHGHEDEGERAPQSPSISKRQSRMQPIAPTDAQGKKTPHGTGSRHMFASNRRRSVEDALSVTAGGSFSINPRSPARSVTQSVAGGVPRFGTETWLNDLARALEAREEYSVMSIADAITRLDESGVLEEQLRTCITDRDLEELGIEGRICRGIVELYGVPLGNAGGSRTFVL